MLGTVGGYLQERGIREISALLRTLIRITLRPGMPWHYAWAEFYFVVFFL
jgi:hypothetical protein